MKLRPGTGNVQRYIRFLLAGACFAALFWQGHISAQTFAAKETTVCPVIPRPAEAERAGDQAYFLFSPAIDIEYNSKGSQAADIVAYLKARLQALKGPAWSGLRLGSGRAHGKAHAAAKLVLTLIPAGAQDHGLKKEVHDSAAYQLTMTADSVCIQAYDARGLFYGVNSFLQLALNAAQPQKGKGGGPAEDHLLVPCWHINDQPALSWRGFMLDESRHFFGKEKVKQLLDWMAFYKLNYFHWHLTDEPGWRLEIRQYPKLTTIGGRGNKTDSSAAARYYTQADIREIVRYAGRRYIQVIPEIDMPGHATAANRGYPEMSGGGTGKYANFTFDPGADKTYGFLTRILRETAGLFPVHMVHLGGDEVAFGSKSWAGRPDVQRLMKQQHLSDLKAVEGYFLRRMADSALQFNRRVLAWDEAVDAGLPADKVIICWWRHDHPEQLRKALQRGYAVVFCPRIPLYFDFVQDSTHQVGRKWGKDDAGLRQVFDFWPGSYLKANAGDSASLGSRILGIQANLWTETVQTTRRLDFLVFPRMAALATAGWTLPDRRDFSGFEQTLKTQLPLYREAGIHYYDPFDPAKTPEPRQ